MINKQNLLDKLFSASGIYSHIVNEHSPIDGYVLKNRNGIGYLELHYPDGKFIMDNPDYITSYSPLLLDIDFNSIFIIGLGLGVQPYVCQDFAKVDVLEIDENIISINNQLGFLNNNVNIIHGDIFNYSVDKVYDIIVIDIWWETPTDEVIHELLSKIINNVSENGFIYIPISNLKITHS